MENKETPRYDGHCLSLSKEEIEKKMAAGEKYVYRLKIPDEGICVFNDELRGKSNLTGNRSIIKSFRSLMASPPITWQV